MYFCLILIFNNNKLFFMKKVLAKICVLFAFAVPFCGCDGVEGIINMLNCKFEVQEITDFTFADVHFDQLDSISEISDIDKAKIEAAIAAENAHVNFTLNILGTNPNDADASVEKLQWMLAIDGLDVAEGAITNGFSIPANSSNTLSLVIDANMTDVYKDSVVENVYNLYQDIVNGEASIATIKIKPTINETEFPDYITVKYPIKKEEE